MRVVDLPERRRIDKASVSELFFMIHTPDLQCARQVTGLSEAFGRIGGAGDGNQAADLPGRNATQSISGQHRKFHLARAYLSSK